MAYYEDETTNEIQTMLQGMTSYMSSMVDPTTQRFYALSRPPTGELLHQHCPIRDLAAAWDATTLLQHHKGTKMKKEHQKTLESAVISTLQAYPLTYTADGIALLDSKVLLEPSNIAHSALYLLALLGAAQLNLVEPHVTRLDNLTKIINDLTRGILCCQRPDGAFQIQFLHDDVYKGIDFFPGEAMVALMEVHQSGTGVLNDSTMQSIIPSMQAAFRFYFEYYRQAETDTNYNIWQIQAFARLVDVKPLDEDGNKEVAKYVLELCHGIVESQSWKMLCRGRAFYPNLNSVEIGCGLDALALGMRVVARGDDKELLSRYANHAIQYLRHVQDQVRPDAAVGYGGLGYGGIQVLEQRLDVTGHAMSALVKLLQVQQEGKAAS
jgi:hypothetical protein